MFRALPSMLALTVGSTVPLALARESEGKLPAGKVDAGVHGINGLHTHHRGSMGDGKK